MAVSLGVSATDPSAKTNQRAVELIERVEEIRNMDFKSMERAEKKEMKVELRQIKKELRQIESTKGLDDKVRGLDDKVRGLDDKVSISIGAIIIILLLIIIL